MAQNPYYVDPGNDYSAGLSGLSNTLTNVRQQRMQEAEQRRRQEKDDADRRRFQEVQTAAMQAFESQDPDVIARTAVQYPEITEILKQSAGLKDDVQNRDALEFTRAFATATPEARPALYERRIKTLQEQKRDPSNTIQSYQDYMQNPEAETRDVISYWAGIDPKGYGVYSEEQKAAAKERLERQKFDHQQSLFNQAESGRNSRAAARNALTRANTAATASGAGASTAHMKDYQYFQSLPEGSEEKKAFGQAAGFISKEGRELQPQLQKRLSIATDDAIAAENNAAKFTNLANDIDKAGIGGGVAGQFSEKLKELTGEQDALSALRREYNAIKGSQVVSNLPPGAASDKDIEMAMAGFPTDRASGAQIAGFLRGLAKLQSANAELQNHKADYITKNGTERGMLQSWKDRAKGGSSGGTAASPPAVTTQAQFDALPSGAVYLEDGVQYRKP